MSYITVERETHSKGAFPCRTAEASSERAVWSSRPPRWAALAACSRTSTGGDGGGDGGSDGGGGGDLLSQLQDAGTITVGFAGEAPYSFEDGGELMGATVALHREIFGELGIENVEGRLTDWGSLIPRPELPSVRRGQRRHVDPAPDRCAEAAFSEPEFQYTTALMVPRGATPRVWWI